MLKIGSHVSMKGPDYYLGSVNEALSYNANTFMFYTGAPTSSIRSPLGQLKIEEAKRKMEENGIDINDVVVHAPYLINLGNLDPEKNEFALNFLISEIDRTLKMGAKYLVLHPGASMNYERTESLNQIASCLNVAISKNPEIKILIETMAGKGSEVGSTFEEVAYIINKISKKDSIGVCLDTCHINDAGYDLKDPDGLLAEFDRIIGLNYLYVIHLNDSKNEIGAHKDRHENIGYGKIGFETLMNFVNHPKINDRIFILETPYINDKAPYKDEINEIRTNTFNPHLQ